MIDEYLIVGFEEFEWFWDARHGSCGRPYYDFEFSEGSHLILNESFYMCVNLFFEFAVFDALHRAMGTRSSSGFWSFFLLSFLGADSVIFKNNSNNIVSKGFNLMTGVIIIVNEEE